MLRCFGFRPEGAEQISPGHWPLICSQSDKNHSGGSFR
jgi:hypothetical protein